ncbi:MAG TPA: nucleotide exchange factor GrpE [Trebonia sp.]
MNQTPGNGTAEDSGARPGPDAGAPSGAGSQDAASAATTRPEDPGAAGTTADQAARIAELEDARLRALADLDNLRKRCAAQVHRAEEEARAAVARQWLPVIDSLDLALAHATADPAVIVDGVKTVREQALGVLARLGFPRRDDRGARFDPTRHEAVASRPDPGTEEDLVAEVVRPGYGEGDHQLRPAQVVVARPG